MKNDPAELQSSVEEKTARGPTFLLSSEAM